MKQAALLDLAVTQGIWRFTQHSSESPSNAPARKSDSALCANAMQHNPKDLQAEIAKCEHRVFPRICSIN